MLTETEVGAAGPEGFLYVNLTSILWMLSEY